ncbi:hypothetical protein PQI66_07250 [Corynebacterium sp. USCH3]|uniref:hypothetical protein n=1 Tax=Corynebacterium sp. USCH3 TaxID=3024840 RepID=UPI0030A0DF87
MNTRSPIEAALDNYVEIVAAASEKFRRQMDEATRLLEDVRPGESPERGDETAAAGTARAVPPGPVARRRPGIFD